MTAGSLKVAHVMRLEHSVTGYRVLRFAFRLYCCFFHFFTGGEGVTHAHTRTHL